ncbi:GTP cyclohydrolase II-domain-containing protein [Mycena filopes]|nr:GTP cyclohydrolase II-domain-containing protein [Mycena filopes]
MPQCHNNASDVAVAPAPPSPKFDRRDAALDPLMIAAAAASGPHITRNHYHHEFFPGAMLHQHDSSKDWAKVPRRDAKENDDSPTVPLPPKKRRASLVGAAVDTDVKARVKAVEPAKPVEVKCMARTRIPTPHGMAFLHLYHNSRDTKEHLALIPGVSAPAIRSHSLDAVWDEDETEMDRITRGAYVGRLCFTGETVGSMRCDCGEQLDEAIRLISQPIPVPALSSLPGTAPATIPGRGAVIYLRQEGRGIGLLSKIRAYNLQDLGHDTVTANLMLGHGADERGYEIAAAILRDLALDDGVRLLTNNPDKVDALQKEGMTIVERVPMGGAVAGQDLKDGVERVAGATLIGGNSVHGEDLDKYLRTKVLRMGHMLPLWMENPEQEVEQPQQN